MSIVLKTVSALLIILPYSCRRPAITWFSTLEIWSDCRCTRASSERAVRAVRAVPVFFHGLSSMPLIFRRSSRIWSGFWRFLGSSASSSHLDAPSSIATCATGRGCAVTSTGPSKRGADPMRVTSPLACLPRTRRALVRILWCSTSASCCAATWRRRFAFSFCFSSSGILSQSFHRPFHGVRFFSWSADGAGTWRAFSWISDIPGTATGVP